MDVFCFWFPAKTQTEHEDFSLVKYLPSNGLDHHPTVSRRTFFFSSLQTKAYEAIPVQTVQRSLWCYTTPHSEGTLPTLPAYLLRS